MKERREKFQKYEKREETTQKQVRWEETVLCENRTRKEERVIRGKTKGNGNDTRLEMQRDEIH